MNSLYDPRLSRASVDRVNSYLESIEKAESGEIDLTAHNEFVLSCSFTRNELEMVARCIRRD